MKNQKVKILALVMAGCLCITGLTGCGGGERTRRPNQIMERQSL